MTRCSHACVGSGQRRRLRVGGIAVPDNTLIIRHTPYTLRHGMAFETRLLSWRPPAPASTALVQERARAPKPGARTPWHARCLPSLAPSGPRAPQDALAHSTTPARTLAPHPAHTPVTTHTVLTLHFHPHARSTRLPPRHTPRPLSRPTTPAPIAAAPSTPAPPANSAVKGSLTRRRRNARHEHSNRRLGNPRSRFGPQPPLRVTALEGRCPCNVGYSETNCLPAGLSF